MKLEELKIWKRSARLSAELHKHFAENRDLGFRIRIDIGIDIGYISHDTGYLWFEKSRQLSAQSKSN